MAKERQNATARDRTSNRRDEPHRPCADAATATRRRAARQAMATRGRDSRRSGLARCTAACIQARRRQRRDPCGTAATVHTQPPPIHIHPTHARTHMPHTPKLNRHALHRTSEARTPSDDDQQLLPHAKRVTDAHRTQHAPPQHTWYAHTHRVHNKRRTHTTRSRTRTPRATKANKHSSECAQA